MSRSRLLTFLLIYGAGIFLTLNRHSKAGLFDYHSEVSADKAGYFVYIPAAFLYNFQAQRFPAAIDSLTGYGFQLNRATGKVATKYPYGVALLEAPFWLVAHALRLQGNGFSSLEQKSVNIAAVTFFTLGLLLLYSTLRYTFSRTVVAFSLLALTLGTNLWHYAYYETGMAHVYSFFAFAWLLWLLIRPNQLPWTNPHTPTSRLVGIATALALISLLRPLDLLVALPLVAWPITPGSQWSAHLRGIFQVRFGCLLLALLTLAWLPQLFYYHYLHGEWVVYSYGSEGFPNLLQPKLAELWFAPNNGSLLYNPLLLVILGPGCWVLSRRSRPLAGLALGCWGLLSYAYASWWSYNLGCGYAGRGFVDIYPLLAWALACLLEAVATWYFPWRWVTNLLLVALVCYNMELVWHFDRCFTGSRDWDWAAYRSLWSADFR